jgi:glutamate-1-semialdehyde 2,1-aminomutase
VIQQFNAAGRSGEWSGVIAPSFIVSYSHDDEAIERTIDAIDQALRVYRKVLDDGMEHYLVGPAVKPVYRRFN